MRNFIIVVLIGVLVAILGCGRDQSPQSSDHVAQTPQDMHDDHAPHAEAPVLQPGQRWPTDEPLRQSMLKIRAATEQAAIAYENRRMTASGANELAAVVDENVKYMIANCKLAPEPDAALHALIGRMLTAAATLQKEPASESGVPQLLAALREYQSTFDHAGWAPLQAH